MLKTDIVIIGSGETGLILAQEILKTGENVILLEQSDFGGTYINSVEYPMQVFRSEAEKFLAIKKVFKSDKEVIKKLDNKYKNIFTSVKKKCLDNADRILEELLSEPNFQYLQGRATFTSDSMLEVNSKQERHLLTFEKCILALGQTAMMPPKITGLSKIKFFHQENFWKEKKLPKSILFNELTLANLNLIYSLAAFGVEVKVVTPKKLYLTLDRLDKDLAYSIKIALEELGVEFFESRRLTKVTKEKTKLHCYLNNKEVVKVNNLFVEMENIFVDEDLSLDKGRVNFSKKGINIDHTGRTKNPKVWAFGSCTNQNPAYRKFLLWDYLSGQRKIQGFRLPFIKHNTNHYFQIVLDTYYFQAGLSQKDAVDKYGPGLRVDRYNLNPKEALSVLYRPENNKVVSIYARGDSFRAQEKMFLQAVFGGWELAKLYKQLGY